MIGFNHALTGGLIAKYLPLPLALLVAFISHFALDTLPHFGINPTKKNKSWFWKIFTSLDAFATLGLAIYAIYDRHYAMFLGGLAGVMPDFIWVGTVVKTRSFDFRKANSRFARWHSGIQGRERPWGILIEIPLAAVLFYVVMIKIW